MSTYHNLCSPVAHNCAQSKLHTICRWKRKIHYAKFLSDALKNVGSRCDLAQSKPIKIAHNLLMKKSKHFRAKFMSYALKAHVTFKNRYISCIQGCIKYDFWLIFSKTYSFNGYRSWGLQFWERSALRQTLFGDKIFFCQKGGFGFGLAIPSPLTDIYKNFMLKGLEIAVLVPKRYALWGIYEFNVVFSLSTFY